VDLKASLSRFLKDEPLLVILYSKFGGLCEFYCFWLLLATCYFEYRGKLEPSFAAAITAICGILALHDALDDHFKDRQAQRDTNVNVTVNNG
jgi:hypothetical protein